ncbi:MAG: site-specific tyrosine recombinase XerD [Candidatus Nanopelagicales bacterium]|nr:site-specific tyrosine recombinase XerD [Candidatus Nanopelagicales bacterium]
MPGQQIDAPGSTQIARVATEYLDHLVVEKGISPNTLDAYRRDLGRYTQFCAARSVTSLTDATESLIGDFLGWLRSPGQEGPELSAASAARTMAAVRGLHGFAVREGLLADNSAVSVKPPTLQTRLPHGLAVQQVLDILRAPDPAEPTGVRDRALLEFLYGSGCRASEAVGLDVDDVDLEARAVLLRGKGRKERIVPIGTLTVTALESYSIRVRPALAARGKGTAAMFLNSRGGRLSRQTVWTVLKRAAKTAGVDGSVHPHTLRHSFATHLLQGGADVRVVQELLGHASVTTTQIYTMVTVEHLREVYANTHPRGRM